MSLGDAVADALPRLQAQAESMMRDTVTIERETGEFVTDDENLEQVPEYAPVYSGKARIQRTNSLSPSDTVVGGFEFTTSTFIAQLPIAAAGIKAGDRCRVTATTSSDPDLLGLTGTVRGNLTKSHPTKRTLVCEEVG